MSQSLLHFGSTLLMYDICVTALQTSTICLLSCTLKSMIHFHCKIKSSVYNNDTRTLYKPVIVVLPAASLSLSPAPSLSQYLAVLAFNYKYSCYCTQSILALIHCYGNTNTKSQWKCDKQTKRSCHSCVSLCYSYVIDLAFLSFITTIELFEIHVLILY